MACPATHRLRLAIIPGMHTSLDCVPCLLRQAVDAVKLATDDPELRQRAVRAVLAEAARLDPDQPAPLLAGRIHGVVCRESGNPDPYLALKRRCNRLALARLDGLRARAAAADDPLAAAVRIAIAGNVIDFSVRAAGDDLTDDLDRAVDEALHEPFEIDHVAALARAIPTADSILYLCDNAGEVVFDRLLLERLPPGRVTIAAKAGPAINDATVDDAIDAGLDRYGPVVSTGSRYPGTVLADCSAEFRRRFAAAQLIIAKGQANYETLAGGGRAGLFFLFRVKCPMVAGSVGAPVGSWITAEDR